MPNLPASFACAAERENIAHAANIGSNHPGIHLAYDLKTAEISPAAPLMSDDAWGNKPG
jgi:hypothetical protein